MRILFIIPSLAGGGAERVVAMLASELARNHAVKVVTFEDHHEYAVNAEVESLGFPAYTSRVGEWLPLVPTAGYRLLRSVHRFRPDVCISFMVYPNLLNAVVGLFHRRPTVLSVRTTLSAALPDSHRRSRLARQAIRHVFPFADGVVAISRGVARDLVQTFSVDPSLIHTIYNPIDLSAVHTSSCRPVPAEMSDLFQRPVVINVARLVPEKGQWSLIRAFGQARRQEPAAKLVIVGDGPLHDYLVDVAVAAQLRVWSWRSQSPPSPESFDVFLTGHVKDPFHFVKAARLFAFTSVLEGFGNVLLESIAVGTPVLSADCPSGPRELLAPALEGPSVSARHEGPYGVLMPPFPPPLAEPGAALTELEYAWGAVMSALLVSETDGRGPAALARLRAEEFSVERVAAEWLTYLEDICNRRIERANRSRPIFSRDAVDGVRGRRCWRADLARAQ